MSCEKKDNIPKSHPLHPPKLSKCQRPHQMRMFQLGPFIGQNGALASTGLTKHISMHPTITLCGRERSIFSEVAEQSFTFLRGGQKTEVCTCFMHSAAFSISCSKVFFLNKLIASSKQMINMISSNKSSNRHSWLTQACPATDALLSPVKHGVE